MTDIRLIEPACQKVIASIPIPLKIASMARSLRPPSNEAEDLIIGGIFSLQAYTKQPCETVDECLILQSHKSLMDSVMIYASRSQAIGIYGGPKLINVVRFGNVDSAKSQVDSYARVLGLQHFQLGLYCNMRLPMSSKIGRDHRTGQRTFSTSGRWYASHKDKRFKQADI